MSAGLVHSFNVLTTLLAQRIVAFSTSTANTVIYPATNQMLPCGISVNTVLDTTSAIPIKLAGSIAKVLFNDTATVGQLVSSDSSGRAIGFVLSNTTTSLTLASAYVGVLRGEAVALTGTIAEVLIMPGFSTE